MIRRRLHTKAAKAERDTTVTQVERIAVADHGSKGPASADVYGSQRRALLLVRTQTNFGVMRSVAFYDCGN